MRLGGGPGFSAGSVGVTGLETGIGVGVEAGVLFGSGRLAAGPSLTFDAAGYVASGDGDPIISASIEGRLRGVIGPLRDTLRPFWAAGVGFGLVTYIGAGASIQGELGLDWSPGAGIVLGVSLRERLAMMGSGGSPPFEPLNTVQLVLSLGWRTPE